MGRTKGTYTLTSNIELKVGAPLDARTIVKLLADLTASNTFEYPYKGMRVFVEENNKSYTLVGSDPTVSTNWIEDNSGGHTIKNPAGTAMTQRSNLQFVDLTVSDDSTNDVTKVESVHVIQSESELANLPDGLYMLDDDEDTIIDGNLVGYDNTDSELNAENVQDAIDEIVETLDDKIDISTKGVANGVAELDSAGKVPSSQLPSFVDDVIEVADYDHLPATGETGKIYVTLDTNKTYRWGGTEYVEISESLALGETSSTAYRGDRGKTAYEHSQTTSGNPHNVTKSDVGLGNVNNTSDKNKPLSDATKNALLLKLGVEALTHYYEPNMVVEMSRYAEGSNIYVESEGRMYRATTDIDIGDTLVVDTNCVPVDIQYMIMEKLGVDNLTSVVEPVDRASSAHTMYSRFYLGYLNKWAKATANISVNDMLVMGTNYEIITIEDVFGSIENVLSQMSTSISNKVNKVSGATDGHIAGLDANGNLTDSGLAATTIVHKADKVSGQVAGHLASLSGTGNLADSGWNGAKDTTSISGNPISIPDLKANQLAINPIITLEPIQAGSGTPSPVNQRPISGYDKVEALSCGVNVWNEHWELGYYNPSTGEPVSSSSNIRTPINEPIIVFGNATYYWKQSYNGRVLFYDSANNFITSTVIATGGNTTFTTPSNAKYMRFQISSDYGTVYKNDLSINYPATQTSYVPYNKATSISESLGQTVYGLTHEVRTGKARVTHKDVDMGNLTWSYYTSGSRPFFYAILSDVSGTATPNNSWCEIYPVVTDYADKSMYWNGTQIRVFDNSYTDATTFTNAVSGKKLVYPLATPTEIQLTPHEISLLKDYAYVSTNGTNITLDYHNGELASLADVSQLGETVNELGKALKRVLLPITQYYFTSATTLTYTGCNITIPANSIFTINVSAIYANSSPNYLLVADRNDVTPAFSTYYSSEQAMKGSISGRTNNTALTLYVWARYANATENIIEYSGWYETL